MHLWLLCFSGPENNVEKMRMAKSHVSTISYGGNQGGCRSPEDDCGSVSLQAIGTWGDRQRHRTDSLWNATLHRMKKIDRIRSILIEMLHIYIEVQTDTILCFIHTVQHYSPQQTECERKHKPCCIEGVSENWTVDDDTELFNCCVSGAEASST